MLLASQIFFPRHLYYVLMPPQVLLCFLSSMVVHASNAFADARVLAMKQGKHGLKPCFGILRNDRLGVSCERHLVFSPERSYRFH